MTDVVAEWFIDVHTCQAKLDSFLDGNCFLIASTVSEYSQWQMMLRVLADGNTSVSNSSNHLECFRVGVGTGTEPL